MSANSSEAELALLHPTAHLKHPVITTFHDDFHSWIFFLNKKDQRILRSDCHTDDQDGYGWLTF